MRATLISLLLFSSLSFSSAGRAESCQDSDGGSNPKVKGTVLMMVGPSSQQFITKETDACKDKNTLIEYYCDKENHSVTQIIHCQNGCDKGICK
jgi:hypothetical protein